MVRQICLRRGTLKQKLMVSNCARSFGFLLIFHAWRSHFFPSDRKHSKVSNFTFTAEFPCSILPFKDESSFYSTSGISGLTLNIWFFTSYSMSICQPVGLTKWVFLFFRPVWYQKLIPAQHHGGVPGSFKPRWIISIRT